MQHIYSHSVCMIAPQGPVSRSLMRRDVWVLLHQGFNILMTGIVESETSHRLNPAVISIYISESHPADRGEDEEKASEVCDNNNNLMSLRGSLKGSF